MASAVIVAVHPFDYIGFAKCQGANEADVRACVPTGHVPSHICSSESAACEIEHTICCPEQGCFIFTSHVSHAIDASSFTSQHSTHCYPLSAVVRLSRMNAKYP